MPIISPNGMWNQIAFNQTRERIPSIVRALARGEWPVRGKKFFQAGNRRAGNVFLRHVPRGLAFMDLHGYSGASFSLQENPAFTVITARRSPGSGLPGLADVAGRA
jgi:hypothetical protein